MSNYVGFNTINLSDNTLSFDHYKQKLKMNKVELGKGIKGPNQSNNSTLQRNKRMSYISNRHSSADGNFLSKYFNRCIRKKIF